MNYPEYTSTVVIPDEKSGLSCFLTKIQMSTRLQISLATLNRLMKEGMPTIKIGHRTVRFDEHEVRKWLNSKNQQKGVING